MILRCCNDVPTTARWWVTLLLCISFLAPRCTSEHRIESFLLGSGDDGDASFSGHLRHGRRLADGSTSSASSTPIKSTKRIEGAMIIDEKKYREGGLKSRHKLSHAKEFSAALFGNASGNWRISSPHTTPHVRFHRALIRPPLPWCICVLQTTTWSRRPRRTNARRTPARSACASGRPSSRSIAPT